MRWTWVILLTSIVVAAGLGFLWRVQQEPPAPAPSTETQPQREEASPVAETDRTELAMSGYAEASEDMRALAVAVFNGTPLPADALSRVTPEELSAFYDTTVPKELATKDAPAGMQVRRNLLLDAFAFDRQEAGKAVVEAGADVNVADHLMAYNALAELSGSRMVPFPDFSKGMPWLRLYVENGGDLHAQRPGTSQTLLQRAAGLDNLEGLLYLLEKGADGWRPAVRDGFAYKPFFDDAFWGSAGIIGSEIAFRIAVEGHIQDAKPEQLAPILNDLTAAIDRFEGPGPDSMNTVWRLRAVAQAILDHSNVAAPEPLAEQLRKPFPEDIGGWHLRPDEVRSPPRDRAWPDGAGHDHMAFGLTCNEPDSFSSW
ncbi:hypothetical protein [Vannielia litorea]|uniref:Uncharacterized protein n=1 Tax=Vannielia litorea TaxID=1217970 RepID=A0A1N6IEC4_9RHOB|nr:hypothetical protein [Vannielia litorea]SIO30363.1 hypothetical protein SAMN05444002_3768 [Vannielia litorea]